MDVVHFEKHTLVGVLLDVREVGAIVHEDRRDIRGHSSGGLGLNPLEESYSRCVAYGGDVMQTFARAPARSLSSVARSRQSPQIRRC